MPHSVCTHRVRIVAGIDCFLLSVAVTGGCGEATQEQAGGYAALVAERLAAIGVAP